MPESRQPLIFPSAGQTSQEANFYRLPWKLVCIGYRKSYPNTGAYHLNTNSTIPYHLMTWHELFSGSRGTAGNELRRLRNIESHPIIFIGMTFLVFLAFILTSNIAPTFGLLMTSYYRTITPVP
jgi:hypothetical protein